MVRANTEFVYLSGKAKWARVYNLNKYGRWAIDLYPDKDSLEIIRELQTQGIKNKLKKDEDGYYMTFSRPSSLKTKQGHIVALQQPLVLDTNNQPTQVAIGNGSDVTIKLEVYRHSTPSGGYEKAARLNAIRIDNLVPFDAERDFPEDVEKEFKVKDILEQPARVF